MIDRKSSERSWSLIHKSGILWEFQHISLLTSLWLWLVKVVSFWKYSINYTKCHTSLNVKFQKFISHENVYARHGSPRADVWGLKLASKLTLGSTISRSNLLLLASQNRAGLIIRSRGDCHRLASETPHEIYCKLTRIILQKGNKLSFKLGPRLGSEEFESHITIIKECGDSGSTVDSCKSGRSKGFG